MHGGKKNKSLDHRAILLSVLEKNSLKLLYAPVPIYAGDFSRCTSFQNGACYVHEQTLYKALPDMPKSRMQAAPPPPPKKQTP
jgi:hypothetical protein